MLGEGSSLDLYSKKSYFKWGVLAISLVIGLGSILYTNGIVSQIRDREKKQVALYAKTLEYLANSEGGGDLIFLLEDIIQSNKTIPVILTDENNTFKTYINIPEADRIENLQVKSQFLTGKIEKMKKEQTPIEVVLRDPEGNSLGRQFIYYQNSYLLKQLAYYPYVQLSVIVIFGLITYALFNSARSAEQNRVWVGLAKETAHQLGTPISSLIAWVEYLKSMYSNDENIDELNKDISRLEMITARFSSIGSEPQLRDENVYNAVKGTIDYLQKRLSTKIDISIKAFPDKDITAKINNDLFSWVLENLCKNAADAMEGRGAIDIQIMKVNDGKVAIDVSDTGKGITRAKVKKIFEPGFTTKRRGWGLGLTLVQRIVDIYHQGKISVKKTEIGVGTTFRILLNS